MGTRKLKNAVVAIAVGGTCLSVSETVLTTKTPPSFVSQAEARFGRVGIARGHYRRAVVAGAIAGGVLAAGYGYGYGYGAGYPSYGYNSAYPYYGYGVGYPNYGYQSYGYGYGYPYSYASYGWRQWW
jgi:hypothetical protein